MKRKLLLFGLMTLVVMTSCSKKDEVDNSSISSVPATHKKELVKVIFAAGMDAYSTNKSALLRSATIDTVTFTFDPNYYVISGPAGGNVALSGNILLTESETETTSALKITYDLTESYNSFAYNYEGVKYTLIGAPNLKYGGSYLITMNNTTNSFYYDSSSKMTMKGAIRVVSSDGLDAVVNLDLVISISANGEGGTVSGTIDGEPYSESL